jgi:flagellum-specific peptidoglycan hydrolase FlgJ
MKIVRDEDLLPTKKEITFTVSKTTLKNAGLIMLGAITSYAINRMFNTQPPTKNQPNILPQTAKPILASSPKNATKTKYIDDDPVRYYEQASMFSAPKNKNIPQYEIDFIKSFEQLAVEESKFSGINVATYLGMSAYESKFGISDLAKNAKNYFGIKKGTSWTGAVYGKGDDEWQWNGKIYHQKHKPHKSAVLTKSRFRVYDSRWFSFRDFTNYVKAKGLNLKGLTTKEQISKIHKSGYSTDPEYIKNVMSIVGRLQLEKLNR